MCYVYGSTDYVTGVCPMCKYYKPSTARCPHIKEVCRNHTLHPRHDVVYLKNAEVQTFSGCGFCKWANTNPPPRLSGHHNPGWPGCCRAPTPQEYKFIGAADWPAVSVVHHIPIPPQIKLILESLSIPLPIKGSSSPTGSLKAPSARSAAPSIVRRASDVVTNTSRADTGASRSPPMPVPTRARSGGSPQQATGSLSAGNAVKNTDGDNTVSSLPSKSAMDQFQVSPRRSVEASNDRRAEVSATSPHSPGRRNADLGGSISRRSIERRPSLSSALPTTSQRAEPTASQSPGSKNAGLDGNTPRRSIERRPSLSSNLPSTTISKATLDVPNYRKRGSSVSLRNPSPQPPKERSERSAVPPLPRRNAAASNMLDESFATMSVSGSSNSSGSNSDTTVISDGGFTDYLSDESEAELQRQAEAKAALLAQNQLEEQEFKAARQQLASIDLRPPKSWTGNVNVPRSQAAATR